MTRTLRKTQRCAGTRHRLAVSGPGPPLTGTGVPGSAVPLLAGTTAPGTAAVPLLAGTAATGRDRGVQRGGGRSAAAPGAAAR